MTATDNPIERLEMALRTWMDDEDAVDVAMWIAARPEDRDRSGIALCMDARRIGHSVTVPDRCESVQGSLQCQGSKNHRSPHWANTHGHAGPRWGLSDYGCLVGIEQGLVCRKTPGHPLPHNNGKGMSWDDSYR